MVEFPRTRTLAPTPTAEGRYLALVTHTYIRCPKSIKQVTNALVKVFVEVEQEWMGHVAALPDPQTRVQKVGTEVG